MAYEKYTIKGRLFWPKLFSPDEYLGRSFYKVTIFPEDKSVFKEYKAKGGMAKPKLDDETGEMSFTFRRDTEKVFNGKKVWFSPPVITGVVQVSYRSKDGVPVWSYDDLDKKPERVGEPVMIGNGSLGEVTLSLYDIKGYKGKGSRLEEVKVLELVEYNKEEEAKENAPKPNSPW